MDWKFDWDEEKNRANFLKHEIRFEEAQTIWEDVHAQEFFDQAHSQNEERFFRVGHSIASRMLLVVFCELTEYNVIRIISARRATKTERKEYEEGI